MRLDLHIYHGRVKIEPGFTIGHEYVGTVLAAGPGVTEVSVGDRVLGCFHTACGGCWFCRRGLYQNCPRARTFGHGATLGSLEGTQAEMALVPHANLVLRRVPDGMSSDTALFAGDVMGTGFHAVDARACAPATPPRSSGLARSASARSRPPARSERRACSRWTPYPGAWRSAESFGAVPVHLEEQDVFRAIVKAPRTTAESTCAIDAGRAPSGSRHGDSPHRQAEAFNASASTRSGPRCTWGCCG